MTACYNQQQAFLSAGLGAEYVAPYLGRMGDAGKDGVEECAQMQEVISGMGSTTRVLVASLRSVSQVSQSPPDRHTRAFSLSFSSHFHS